MADGNELTDIERDKILNWMRSHAVGDQICPVCKNTNWVLADHLVQPVTINRDNGLLLGGLGYPQVMFISPQCGYTFFMNAAVVGILRKSPEEKS